MIEVSQVIYLDYTNWRGERREYKVRPGGLVFRSNRWHPKEQWMMVATVLKDTGHKRRFFPLANIHRMWSEPSTSVLAEIKAMVARGAELGVK